MRGLTAMLVGAGLLAGSPASAQLPPGMAALNAARATASKPLATLKYGTAPQQFGQLRLPPGKGPFPVAVLIHGGCFLRMTDDASGLAALADGLAKRGIATWNLEYRITPDPGSGWPGTFRDIAAGVDHLKVVARRYPLDMKRAALVGHSAGAYFALFAASRPKLGGEWAKTAWRPASVAAIDGPGTLTPYVGMDKEECGRPVLVPLMGATPAAEPARWRLASPQDQLPFGMRVLTVKTFYKFALDPFEAAVRKGGDPLVSLAPPGGNHFDIITPGTPSGEAVLDFLAANLFPAQSARRSTKK